MKAKKLLSAIAAAAIALSAVDGYKRAQQQRRRQYKGC